MHQVARLNRLKAARDRLIGSIQSRSMTSAAGVVRVVKPNIWNAREGTSDNVSKINSTLLENRPVTAHERSDRVSNDVRVADLFRKYKQDSANPSVIVSVIDSLASIGIEGGILLRFPGFIHLMTDASKLMNRGSFSFAETLSMIENLSKLGIKKLPGKGEGLDFDALSTALSNQLVSHLETIPKTDLMNALRVVECEIKMPLDNYFYYCLNKELLNWAVEQSHALPTETFIREVLGPLQNLTLAPLFKRTSVLDNPAIQSKMIELIRTKSLNHLLTIELISNLQAADKSKFFSVIQAGVSEILNGPNRDRLMSDISDFSIIVSALPSEPLLRDSAVQSDLESILLTHLSAHHSDSRSIRKIVTSVSDLIVSNGSETEREILKLSAPIIRDNISVLSQISADRLSNLFYIFSKGTVNFESESESFRAVCADLEGFVIGRLPALSTSQLSKLSLTFASGIVNHTNSFRALGASIRRRIDSFEPSDFTDAIFGLAHGGLLVKSALSSSVNRVAESVPTIQLPKLAWSVAVADYTVPSTWDAIVARIEKEILSKPDVLGSLSASEEALLYEALVAVKVNNFTTVSRAIDRRLAQFDSARHEPQDPISVALLSKLDMTVKVNLAPPTGAKFSALRIPAYIPEHRLILDLTTDAIVHSGSGVTGGSAKLRHSLWSKLGYNVIAVSDSQFANCATEDEKISALKNIIDQFVVELSELPAAPIEPEPTGRERLSRFWKSREQADESSKKVEESVWESRPTDRRPRLDNSQWTSRA